MDDDLKITAFKSITLASAPTYGSYASISTISTTNEFSIKKYSTFDLIMNTVVETA